VLGATATLVDAAKKPAGTVKDPAGFGPLKDVLEAISAVYNVWGHSLAQIYSLTNPSAGDCSYQGQD